MGGEEAKEEGAYRDRGLSPTEFGGDGYRASGSMEELWRLGEPWVCGAEL